MRQKTISIEEKQKFYREIALKYVNNPVFREKVRNKIVIFVEGKLSAIVKDRDVAMNYSNKPVFACKIKENTEPINMFPEIQDDYRDIKYNDDKKIYTTNYYNVRFDMGRKVIEEYILDSGTSITTLPRWHKWDFSSQKYEGISDFLYKFK